MTEAISPADLAREELYARSVRRYASEQEAELRSAWREYHERQARAIEATAKELAERHRARAAELGTPAGEGGR